MPTLVLGTGERSAWGDVAAITGAMIVRAVASSVALLLGALVPWTRGWHLSLESRWGFDPVFLAISADYCRGHLPHLTIALCTCISKSVHG
jgi:hypothetical protein